MKRITKKDKEIMEKWIEKHGACYFDYKNKDIILPDGGLFSIEKKKYKARKIAGYKKLPNGNTQILFSKKKIIPPETYKAKIWMQELDETIRYLKNIKRMLNKRGIKTSNIRK
jgi:hypothetical protein